MSSRKALAFSFLDRYAGLLLSILSSMVIARLLTPAEIGVFSVTMVLLSFISAMRDFGAGQYLLQEKQLTPEKIRATWSVQLGLGLGFALIVLAAAVPVSVFYSEPRMRDIMFVLALNFAISPFGSITYAWLMREMRFESLALMRFAGSLVGAAVSIGMAWQGAGAISLAVGSLAATIANAAVATLFRPAMFPWRPGLAGIRRVLSFGGKVSATTVMNSLSYSVPELVLGKAHDMGSVGLYSRANGLAGMFQRLILDATQSVAMPLFAKASREGLDLGPIFLRATGYVTAVGWAFFAAMIVLAAPVVRLLYGPQWDASVPLVRLIAGAMAIGLPSAFCTTALMATGAMNVLVRATLGTAVQYGVLLGAGAFLGLMPLGYAIVAAAVVNVVVWLTVVQRSTPFAWLALARLLAQSAAIAGACGAAAALALLIDGHGAATHVWRVAAAAPLVSLAFLVSIWLTRHPLAHELETLTRRFRR